MPIFLLHERKVIMYKVQPYDDKGYERYHLIDCDNYAIVPEVDGFLKFSILRNFSPNTVQAYAYDLLQYYNFCKSKNIDPLHLGSNRNIMDTFTSFASYLQKSQKNTTVIHVDAPVRAATTINRIMSTIYNYYRYLSHNGICKMPNIFNSQTVRQRNFLSEIVKSKVTHYNLFALKTPKMGIKYITREQYEILLKACRTLRDKIILAMLYEAGMRSGEVCGLHIGDLFDIDHGIVHIVARECNENNARVKNYANGSVLLPSYVTDMIIDYITNRTGKSDYLFLTKDGNPITTKNVAKIFTLLENRTGIHAHAHMLRHGFAVEKIEEGWELYQVQSYLRHSNPASTTVYAEFTDQSKVKRMQEFYRTHEIDTEEFNYAK